tara:strand:+ start:865 stop:1389 length:525 start_codon:yes stop_codon:yes gene_type:complete
MLGRLKNWWNNKSVIQDKKSFIQEWRKFETKWQGICNNVAMNMNSEKAKSEFEYLTFIDELENLLSIDNAGQSLATWNMLFALKNILVSFDSASIPETKKKRVDVVILFMLFQSCRNEIQKFFNTNGGTYEKLTDNVSQNPIILSNLLEKMHSVVDAELSRRDVVVLRDVPLRL